MKPILLGTAIIALLFSSCDIITKRSVKGNGQHTTQTRSIGTADKIKLHGSMNIDLIPGDGPGIKVIADENLQEYVETKNENGWLVIKVKDDYSLRSDNDIKVEITTATLRNLDIAGSGDVNGKGKFSGADKLDIDLAGNSEVSLEVNTPSVSVNIAGSGDVEITGETRSLDIDIAGSGDFKGEKLMAEKASVSIAGSGNAEIFADNELKVDVVGSGDVYYKGNATVKSNIMGSGKVEKR
ncbi:head GIN domain-containing protein [Foetidibacter luteolus]|uniref:head GIN domain-containing protein n=1 Tax=Foetidibacter luteolus TaxID=2608880 RepID=UPI00129B5122|nr:head GIN domain-containing protein [Foetidibacter luteolus]